MGYSKTPMFWQNSATSTKFLPSAVKTEVRLARFLKKKLNFTAKLLPVVKFISNGTISSKSNAGEKQNLHYTRRYTEMSMYSAVLHMLRYMEISMYRSCATHVKDTWKFPCTFLRYSVKVHGNFPFPLR